VCVCVCVCGVCVSRISIRIVFGHAHVGQCYETTQGTCFANIYIRLLNRSLFVYGSPFC